MCLLPSLPSRPILALRFDVLPSFPHSASMKRFPTAAALAVTLGLASAQSNCSSTLTPTNSVQLSVASGYRVQLVATGLSKPRGIEFDTAGNLLVVEQGSGDLTALTFQNNGGCVAVSETSTLVSGQGVSTETNCCGLVLTDIIAQSWTCCVQQWKHPVCFFRRSCVVVELRVVRSCHFEPADDCHEHDYRRPHDTYTAGVETSTWDAAC